MTETGEKPVGEVAQVVATEPAALAASPPAALPARTPSEAERLEALENGIQEANLRIVDDMAHFAEITPDMEGPPEAWVRELGKERALYRFRVAKASWLSPKDAPVALTAAKTIVSNLAKARATRDTGRQGLQLNVLAVFPAQPAQQYEEIVVSDD